MLHVETGATVNAELCPCCGKERRASFGFVHDDADTVAFYYAALAPPSHGERSVTLAVSLGDWGHEVDHATRHAAVLRAKPLRGEIEIAFLDASESPVKDRAPLGAILSRAEVVGSITCDRFVEIAGAVLLEDAEVNDYIAGGRS
ncbi:MAG: hypothetical protein WC538_07355 [Thermoanaerobaculia bacterium]